MHWHTYPALAVAFVNAEHCDVTSQVAVAVRRLLADDDPDWVRDAVGVCLCFTRQREWYARLAIVLLTRNERWGLGREGERENVSAWRGCGVRARAGRTIDEGSSDRYRRRRALRARSGRGR